MRLRERGYTMNLDKILANAHSIAISGHVRPDGDCVGSCLGLFHYIMTWYPMKEVAVYLEEVSDKFSMLSKVDEIQHEVSEDKIYDVYFALDCGSSDRLGFAEQAYLRANVQCCIDHHISNQAQGEYVYVVPSASSTCELIYGLIEKERLNKEIAECLFLGMAHDTGVFQYSNTAPSTMRAAADCLELGVLGSAIIEKSFYEKTYLQNKILGKAFAESQLYFHGTCMVFGISLGDMNALGVIPSDMEGIVSQMRNTRGVDVAVLIYGLKGNEYKISLRSNETIDSSVIAQHFHGGGHKKAAGFSLIGNYEEVLSLVLHEIGTQRKEEYYD